ncbi:MAG: GGDEF domain-containing protein, partial [Synergistaceae bacterium]|nr:GGDEF domain-containing protein [Synergistaceae bacterium]
MAMNNSTINIYVTGKNLAGILSEVSPPSGMLCRVETLDAGIRINAQAMNVFILKKLPSRILDGAKYIICSKSYNEMTADELNALYDLWPEPLTPSLLKFYYRKLLERIQSEQLNTSEEIEHQKRIIEMARQDYLTGLATRWYLQEYIKKNQDEQNVTCVYLDLDNFKKVNDTYGHQAGDRALAATAEMMQRDFTDGFCARMGGDEFRIVLLGLREASDVEKKVNVFMAGLLEYYAGTKTMRALSVSAGIAQKTHGDSKTIDRLIHESDIALYEAKKSGRACCRVYNASM